MLINLSSLDGYAQAMREAPKELLKNLAKGFGEIGKGDIHRLKQNLPGSLSIRAKGLLNSFKYKATDPAKATDASKLFADEYTGWKAAAIFETGGTVTGKGKKLTVLFGDVRNAGGRRKITQAQLRQMIASGQAKFINTPRGTLIVQNKGGTTTKGATRKNSRSVILGMLKTSIHQKKRLDFFANAEKADGLHTDILLAAIEDTLVSILTKV